MNDTHKVELINIYNLKAYLNGQERNIIPQEEEEFKMLLNIKGISVDKKQRTDGRYQGRILQDGKQRSIYGKSIAEVTNKIIDVLKGKKLPTKRKSQKQGTLTVGDWIDEYLRLFKIDTISKKTLEGYIYNAKRIKQKLGHIKLNNLDPLEVQTFFSEITATRLREKIYELFNSALEKAVILKKIKENPLKAVEFKRHKYKEKAILSKEEQKIFEKAIFNNLHEFTYTLILYQALRPSEALAIQKTDIDIENNTISITKSLDVEKQEGKTKTENSNRTIPLHSKVKEVFLRNGTIKRITERALNKHFKRICKKLNLNNEVTVYSLRHCFSTRWEEKGLSRKALSKIMGHVNEVVTKKHYIHAIDQFITDEFTKFDNSFFDTNLTLKNDTKKQKKEPQN